MLHVNGASTPLQPSTSAGNVGVTGGGCTLKVVEFLVMPLEQPLRLELMLQYRLFATPTLLTLAELGGEPATAAVAQLEPFHRLTL